MDSCNFDWELASKFIPLITGLIPIGITWFLYYQWHNQKEKEVIANDCKDLWLKLDNLEKSYKKLGEITSYTIEVAEQKVIEKDFFDSVKEWKYENLSKMNLVKKLTNNDKNIVESVDLLDDKLKSIDTQIMLKRFSNLDELPKLVKQNDVLANIDKVKDSLVPYIKYSKSA